MSITSLVARMCCSPRTSGSTWTPRPWCLCTWACHDGATPATPFTQSLAVAMPEVWQFCARACQPNVTSTSTRHTTQLDTACKPIHISTTTHTRTHTHPVPNTQTHMHRHMHVRARTAHTHTLCQGRALILSMDAHSLQCCFVSRVCSAICQGNVYLRGLSQSLSSLYLCSYLVKAAIDGFLSTFVADVVSHFVTSDVIKNSCVLCFICRTL